jgi:hypothetical protein
MRVDKKQQFQIKNPVQIHLLIWTVIVKLLKNNKFGTIGLIRF